MRTHILNLTSALSGKHEFLNLYYRLQKETGDGEAFRDRFISHVQIELERHDVKEMNPAKLGQIIGEFEKGDVSTSSAELAKQLVSSSDCIAMLRTLVAICLAHVIFDRMKVCHAARNERPRRSEHHRVPVVA